MPTFAGSSVAAAAFVAAAVCVSAHDPIATKVTWDREIAPIVQARCVSCHSAGGRAPMPLTTYDEARPWARAIREEVLTRRMPRWHAVRGYGDFRNDPSLSSFEIALITAWVDGGAPKIRPATVPLRAASAPASEPPHAPAATEPPETIAREIRCGTGVLPAGTLLGLRPEVVHGGSVRVTIATPDGGVDPLLWVRGFDPEAAETYWLRRPRVLSAPARVTLSGDGDCRVTFLLEARTAR